MIQRVTTKAALMMFFIKNFTQTIETMSANQAKREASCWTCGSGGHASLTWPIQEDKGAETSKEKVNNEPEESSKKKTKN